ncbi:MAG: transposase [Gammaproteobacteria bacterium]|nr:transposase [Gammaproteobacteria bacterium]
MQYRRADICGGTYFFTVNLEERNKTLLVDEFDKLRMVFNDVKKRHPFKLDAMVVLPEHIHAMMTLPPNDNDFAKRWMLIKSDFSRLLPKTEKKNTSRQTKGERGIWQRRYWEHLIRDETDYINHVNYIHYNPVKHGYVTNAIDWKYSTIHRYVDCNLLPKNWAENIDDKIEYGEYV